LEQATRKAATQGRTKAASGSAELSICGGTREQPGNGLSVIKSSSDRSVILPNGSGLRLSTPLSVHFFQNINAHLVSPR